MGQFAESLVVAGPARAGWPARNHACRNAQSPMLRVWSSPPSPASSPGPSNHPARAGCESWPPLTWKSKARWRPLTITTTFCTPRTSGCGRPARGAVGNAQDQFAAQVRKSVAGVPDMTRSTRSGSSNIEPTSTWTMSWSVATPAQLHGARRPTYDIDIAPIMGSRLDARTCRCRSRIGCSRRSATVPRARVTARKGRGHDRCRA